MRLTRWLAPLAVLTALGAYLATPNLGSERTHAADLQAPLIQNQEERVCTIVEGAKIRSGPSTDFDRIGGAALGQVFTVNGYNDVCQPELGPWYRLSSGGWMAGFLLDCAAGSQPEYLEVDCATGEVLPTETPSATACALIGDGVVVVQEERNTPAPAQTPSPLSTLSPEDDPNALTVVAWNVKSGEADPEVIADHMSELTGVDLWGLAEVNGPRDQAVFETAAGSNFTSVISQSGGGDRLLAIYDDDRFDLYCYDEVEQINTTGNARAALALHLADAYTDQEFILLVNHLYRSRDQERHEQANLLNGWAGKQTLPIVAPGDYNLDWDVTKGCTEHDLGYDNLTENGVFHWVRPAEIVTTQCSGWPCRYESVLDFIFTAGDARYWRAESDIVVAAGDFPAAPDESDHRPVRAYLWPGVSDQVSKALKDSFYRIAPDSTAEPLRSVARGQVVEPVARTSDNQWLEMYCGEWIPAADVALSGSIKALPTVSPTPIFSIDLAVIINDSTYEILGIVNQGSVSIDIGGWSLTGEFGDDRCTVPAGTSLAPGGVYHVGSGDSDPPNPGLKCSSRPIWNNKGETVWLRDASGQVVVEAYVKRQR